MYKSKLQELCQQQQWALPRYTAMKDGPDHDPSFKASVSLNGTSFHSSTPYKSLKDAQNDAAKSAFLYFTSSSGSCPAATATPHPAQKVDVGLYKNLLQELTQREVFGIPEYKTMKCGQAHNPTFFSRVEVEGEVFHGTGGKSKKEAEQNAAKVAYTNLTEGLLEKYSGEQSPGEPLKSMSTAVESEEHAGELKYGLKDKSSKLYIPDHVASSDFAASVENEEPAEKDEVQEIKAGEKVVANATTSPDSSSSCSKSVPVSPEKGSLSSTLTHLDISTLSISDSNMKEEPAVRSYLLNNRVRVYPCFPDIAFPEGVTVLPISEDKWVAVSLEFPNEKDD